MSHFKYLIVIDFEATCFEKPFNRSKQEIIEFPAVLLSLGKALNYTSSV